MATEIYICRPGQSLKEGKLEYSDSIADKDAAEADAKARCRRDKTIQKVAYYALGDSGTFRCFYTFANPECGAGPAKKAAPAAKPKAKAPKKPTLIERMLAPFRK
ncbi:MAG: hypothetical protein H7841_06885 [Magnetospirillum sp. WYHS-4]